MGDGLSPTGTAMHRIGPHGPLEQFEAVKNGCTQVDTAVYRAIFFSGENQLHAVKYNLTVNPDGLMLTDTERCHGGHSTSPGRPSAPHRIGPLNFACAKLAGECPSN